MSTVLDEIVLVRRKSVEAARQKRSLKDVAESCVKQPAPPSFSGSLRRKGELTIIAEMKRRSPSAGLLVQDYRPAEIAKGYEAAGARALSVLTEQDYFGGEAGHIGEAKKSSKLPVLRKDFTVDEYQIYEARELGASAILLIAAVLDAKTLVRFMKLAQEVGLEALVEAHTESELEAAIDAGATLLGINNRNLKDLSISLDTTFKLAPKVPKDALLVSESGIKTPLDVIALKQAGAHSALIGESLLKSKDPQGSLAALVKAGKA